MPISQMVTYSATYIGPIERLRNHRAIVMLDMEGRLMAQFNCHRATDGTRKLAFGWHEFPFEHFRINSYY